MRKKLESKISFLKYYQLIGERICKSVSLLVLKLELLKLKLLE